MADGGEYTPAQIGESLGVTRSTVYRYLERRRPAPVAGTGVPVGQDAMVAAT
ncbi:helix-turn-helix domain-containing protein [Arthrobacter halodurans]|uniref:Helix-turn-helix domain-containing protein n=1 Tax=Arthrobacter halodurans TaxID=516699 RepID=A0ABV4UPY7_9MICC